MANMVTKLFTFSWQSLQQNDKLFHGKAANKIINSFMAKLATNYILFMVKLTRNYILYHGKAGNSKLVLTLWEPILPLGYYFGAILTFA